MIELSALQPSYTPTPSSDGSLFDGVVSEFATYIPFIYTGFCILLTIWFIISVGVLGLSYVVKNGQWTKFGSGSMIWSFISILVVRGGPILFFALDSYGMIPLLEDLLILVTNIGIYLAIGLFLVSLLFTFFYKLIKHSDFFRWANRLRISSAFTVVLSLVIPYLFI